MMNTDSEIFEDSREKVTVMWCPADSISPAQYGKAVVWISSNGKIGTFRNTIGRDWKWLVNKYSLRYWCYQDEIIPNGHIPVSTEDRF